MDISSFEPNDALLETLLVLGEPDKLLIARLIGSGLLTITGSRGVDGFLRVILGLLTGLLDVPRGVLEDLRDVLGLFIGLPVVGGRLLALSLETLFECLRDTGVVEDRRVLRPVLRGPSDLDRSGVAEEGRVFPDVGRDFLGLLIVVLDLLAREALLRSCIL